jgi:hypothetical protein
MSLWENCILAIYVIVRELYFSYVIVRELYFSYVIVRVLYFSYVIVRTNHFWWDDDDMSALYVY